MLSNQFLKVSLLVLVNCLGIAAAFAEKQEGGISGGGGDRYAAYFANIGGRLDDVYGLACNAPNPNSAIICAQYTKFKAAYGKARVLPKTELLGSDHEPREAGPDGNGNINLNWPLFVERNLKTPDVAKLLSLVAHEYSIAAGLETEDFFGFSGGLLNFLKASYFDFDSIAGEAPKSDSEVEELKGAYNKLLCNAGDRFTAREGTVCLHPDTGAKFVRVISPKFGAGWKDPSGITWQQENSAQMMDHDEAIDYCKNLGGRLPKPTEVRTSFTQGLKFFLKHTVPPYSQFLFWTDAPILAALPNHECGFFGLSSCKTRPLPSFLVFTQDGKTGAPSWTLKVTDATGLADVRFDDNGKLTVAGDPIPQSHQAVRCIKD